MFKRFPGLRRLVVPPFHAGRPIIAIMLVLLWLTYAAPNVLPMLESASTQAIIGLISNSGNRGPSAGLVLSNTAVTFWFDFQNGLLALGALLAINYYRKGRIIGSLAIWTVAGIILILLPVLWIILPQLSLQVEATRILGMILPFSILLVSRLFMRVYAFPGNFWKGAVIIIVFLLVPMNLMLLNPQQVLYHQPETLGFEKRIDLEASYLPLASNHAMAYWMSSYLNTSKPVESDAISHYALSSALPFPSKITSFQEDFPPYTSRRYAVFCTYFVDYDIWTKSSFGRVVSITGLSSAFFQFQVGSTRDVVYSSNRFWIVSPPNNITG